MKGCFRKKEKLCVVTVDMDNLSDYAALYSIKKAFINNDILYQNALPRILDIFDEFDIKATFFVVGRDCARDGNRKFIREIANRGHEVGNHTFEHIALSNLNKDAKRYQVEEADKIISDAIGRKLKGFRAPHLSFAVDYDLVNILEKNGYKYDSSVSGSFFYSLIKRGIFYFTSKGKQKGLLPNPSDIKALFTKNYPFIIRSSSISEIPATVVPFIKMPFLATLSMMTGGNSYFNMVYPLIRHFLNVAVFHLHGSDFFDVAKDKIDSSFYGHPGISLPFSLKTRKFTHIFKSLKKDYCFITAELLLNKV